MTPSLRALILASLIVLVAPLGVAAQERLCDTQSEDCRAPILQLIRDERVGIDVAFWFMEDARYVTELINAKNRGVPVRILVDQRANDSKSKNEAILNLLRDGGIPMRDKYVGDILHFKMFLFHGQNTVEFSKANFTPSSFVPDVTSTNFFDEAVFFTNDDRLTNTFRRRFDDLWINTTQYRNFANVTAPLARVYPIFPIDPAMNFSPLQDFANRAVSRYDRETQSIDAIVFRVTDHRQADAMIRAVARGVPVRLISEPSEYRNPVRLYDSKHIDRMWMAGVQIKMRKHPGLTHEASVVMHGLGEVIFGSSNWTTASAFYQDEHNYFYNPTLGKPWFFQWFADQFEAKWTDPNHYDNYEDFTPLPPGIPTYLAPFNGASGQNSSVTLTWDGGTWAHLYDIYLGTTPTPPLVASNLELGSPDDGVLEKFAVTNLLPGTIYYWRIVGKTWAQQIKSGPTWTFVTAGTAGGGGGSTPFGGSAVAIPGTFEAENFDDGGPSIAYYDAAPGNSGGVYRPTDVDIQATSDTGGGYNLGWTKAGEWLKYTVNVTAAGNYHLETRIANVGTGAKFHVEVNGVDRWGAIAVPDTGGWQAWQTITTTDIALPAGTTVIRVVFTNAGTGGGVGNYNWFRLTNGTAPPPPPPTTTPYPGPAPVALPGIVQPENFDVGPQGVAYSDTTAGNAGAVYRSTDVDIAPTSDPSSNGYYLGWARVGEWLKYTVNVAEARAYTLNARVANVGSGATFRIEVDGVDVTGPVSIPDTGGWEVWQTVSLSGVSLPQGQHVMKLVMLTRNVENNGVGNYSYFSFE